MISRFLHEKLDNSGIFDSHELEVGSPGMEEPLKNSSTNTKNESVSKLAYLPLMGIKQSGILLSADEQELN
jgi:ribosome maturation factor RimP